ncbi:hypothetical protein ACFT7S_00010 [Streptomyces sp. NPDC057136]|uniref:hypothetical protein n=1 Tax=Streptomyces sp. NPDC057136 TaxID=3346029 RepID=UPI00362E6CAD
MKVRFGRAVACLVVSAVASTLLPQVAYAAEVSGDDGEGIIDAFTGWFSDDEGDGNKPEGASTGGNPAPTSREKLPAGKAAPKAKRIAELTGRRTANERFWQLSDGRVQAEVSVTPTGQVVQGHRPDGHQDRCQGLRPGEHDERGA